MPGVTYDNEARWLAESINRSLRYRGFDDYVNAALQSLRRTEAALLATIESARAAARVGDIERAIWLIFRDPISPHELNPLGQDFLTRYGSTAQADPEGFAGAFSMALDEVAPNGQYPSTTPLNVIQAIETLSDILIVPALCFDHAHQFFEQRDAELVIGAKDETQYDGAVRLRHEDCIGCFWRLFDLVVERWRLQWLCTEEPVRIEQADDSLAHLVRRAAAPLNEVHQLRLEWAA